MEVSVFNFVLGFVGVFAIDIVLSIFRRRERKAEIRKLERQGYNVKMLGGHTIVASKVWGVHEKREDG